MNHMDVDEIRALLRDTSMIRSRPRCRRVLLNKKLEPLFEHGKISEHWATGPDGDCSLSDGMWREMKLLIVEGHYPQVVTLKEVRTIKRRMK
jgi:hypothetical protein